MATYEVLPEYGAAFVFEGAAPSAPQPPSYSSQPNENEETVAITPRAGVTTQNGLFIRKWPQATLILRDQDPTVRLPTYGRGARIIGELGLTSPEKVDRVSVKLTGQMSVSVADMGSNSETLCSISQVVWKNTQDPDGAGAEQKCPSILPIQLQFPQSFISEGKAWKLPPSFEATFLGVPALFVRILYTLSITITRTRSYHLASWTTSKTYTTMLTFRPRTRPNRPIVLLDTVFASIKPVPEEWLQVVATMHVRTRPQSVYPCLIKPIECHLFIPSIQTFALTDTIPFHLTLCSTVRSLRELLPRDCPLLQTDGRQHNLSKAQEFRMLLADTPIRVTIARQIIVDVNGRRRARTFPCAIGNLWPVPPYDPPAAAESGYHCNVGAGRDVCMPGVDKAKKRAGAKGTPLFNNATPPGKRRANSSDTDETDDCEFDTEACLDWQGEIKPWAEVVSGGFSTNCLTVKDFLVLALTPSNPRTSPLIPLQLSHPIRLVTDSWIDTDVLHPGDR